MDTTRISSLYPNPPQNGAFLPEGLRAETNARSDHAYVTLVTNPDYLPGAEALLRSLKLTGTRADLVVMHRGIGSAHLARLPKLKEIVEVVVPSLVQEAARDVTPRLAVGA